MSLFIIRTSAVRMKHVRGLVRAGAYMAGVTLVFGALHIRSARADMEDRTVQLGRQMLTLANAAEHEVNKVTLNGSAMWLGNSIAHDPAAKILDRYEAHCQQNAAQPPEAWRELATKGNATPEKKWLSVGIMRGGGLREGSVVCFTKTSRSKASFGEAAKAFNETGDLGALGAVRYVYAKQTEQGNTHVITAWTDDSFNLVDLVGDEGKDVPGQDFGGEISRVPGSRRAFSAHLDGTGFGVNVYQSKDTPTNIVRLYDAELQGQGWTAINAELERHEPGGPPREGRVYEKNGVVLTVAAVQAASDPKEGTITALGLSAVTTGGALQDPGALAGAVGSKKTPSESRPAVAEPADK
jgi:hypothetical protein